MRLRKDIKVVYVYASAVGDAAPGVRVDWGEHVVMTPVLTEHEWVEAQETVSDDVLAVVPSSERMAYRVELIVASEKNKRWSATAIVPSADLEEGEETRCKPRSRPGRRT